MEQELSVIAGPPMDPKAQRLLGIVRYTPPPGTVTRQCHICGEGFYVGPRLLERLRVRPSTTLMCYSCVFRAMEAQGGKSVVQHLGGEDSCYTIDETRVDCSAILKPPRRN